MTHAASTPMNDRQPNRSSFAATPPSRDANPFATCWTRPGTMPFLFSRGETAAQLVARLAAMQWSGAIVGPHGCGKSTLIEALKPALRAVGFSINAITLRNGQRRLPKWFLKTVQHTPAMVIVDGYEQLGWFERLRLKRACRQRQLGLLVTAHSPTRIPTLVRLAPDERLVQSLVAELTANVPALVTPDDVTASHACHGANVREILFDLYDRHEKLRRAERTLTAGQA